MCKSSFFSFDAKTGWHNYVANRLFLTAAFVFMAQTMSLKNALLFIFAAEKYRCS